MIVREGGKSAENLGRRLLWSSWALVSTSAALVAATVVLAVVVVTSRH
jgi:hypothetical protein